MRENVMIHLSHEELTKAVIEYIERNIRKVPEVREVTFKASVDSEAVITFTLDDYHKSLEG